MIVIPMDEASVIWAYVNANNMPSLRLIVQQTDATRTRIKGDLASCG